MLEQEEMINGAVKRLYFKGLLIFRGGDRAELQKDVSAQRSFIYNIVLCMEYNTENSDRQSTAFIVHTSDALV